MSYVTPSTTLRAVIWLPNSRSGCKSANSATRGKTRSLAATFPLTKKSMRPLTSSSSGNGLARLTPRTKSFPRSYGHPSQTRWNIAMCPWSGSSMCKDKSCGIWSRRRSLEERLRDSLSAETNRIRAAHSERLGEGVYGSVAEYRFGRVLKLRRKSQWTSRLPTN